MLHKYQKWKTSNTSNNYIVVSGGCDWEGGGYLYSCTMCTQTNFNKDVSKETYMMGNRGDLHGLARNSNIVGQKTSHFDGVIDFGF